MEKNKALEVLNNLRDSSTNFEQYEVKPYDVEALDYAIRFIEENFNNYELYRAMEVLKALQWKHPNNPLSALEYDRENETILIDKDSLIRVILIANPYQVYRNIRLISREELKNFKRGHRLDVTSDNN